MILYGLDPFKHQYVHRYKITTISKPKFQRFIPVRGLH